MDVFIYGGTNLGSHLAAIGLARRVGMDARVKVFGQGCAVVRADEQALRDTVRIWRDEITDPLRSWTSHRETAWDHEGDWVGLLTPFRDVADTLTAFPTGMEAVGGLGDYAYWAGRSTGTGPKKFLARRGNGPLIISNGTGPKYNAFVDAINLKAAVKHLSDSETDPLRDMQAGGYLPSPWGSQSLSHTTLLLALEGMSAFPIYRSVGAGMVTRVAGGGDRALKAANSTPGEMKFPDFGGFVSPFKITSVTNDLRWREVNPPPKSVSPQKRGGATRSKKFRDNWAREMGVSGLRLYSVSTYEYGSQFNTSAVTQTEWRGVPR